MIPVNVQEMIIKAIKAIFKQGRPSVNGDGRCRYRHGKLKCLVGHLIPNNRYNEDLEGSGIFSIAVRDAAGIPEKYLYVFIELQKDHDNNAAYVSLEDWRMRFRDSVKQTLKTIGMDSSFVDKLEWGN